MRAAFAAAAVRLLDADPRAALVLADISVEGFFEEAMQRHPHRAVNVGIMEQAMIGVAAGFAMEGFRPIAHSLSPFVSERPFEQLKLDFGYQGLGGTFVGAGGSYDYAGEGGTHHAAGDVAAMLAIPGMEVLVPGHAHEVDRLLHAVYANERPSYLRTSLAENREGFDVEPGRIEVVRSGSGPLVVAFGPMLTRTIEACEGLDVTIAYATSVAPFDARGIAAIAGDAPSVVVVEPFYEGSSASVVTAALGHLAIRYGSVGVPRAFIHRYGTWRQLDEMLGLDAAGIGRRIRAFLEGVSRSPRARRGLRRRTP